MILTTRCEIHKCEKISLVGLVKLRLCKLTSTDRDQHLGVNFRATYKEALKSSQPTRKTFENPVKIGLAILKISHTNVQILQ